MALVWLVVLVALATAAGRAACSRSVGHIDQPFERLVLASAVGLGLIGLLVFALGLVGLLSPIAVSIALACTGAASIRGAAAAHADLRSAIGQSRAQRPDATRWNTLLGLALAVLAGTSLIDCFVPPGSHEWDTLSYHLAIPARYIADGRITFIPTVHQSNFPFLTQMLFAVGLLFDGWTLAKLVHWWMSILGVAGIVMMARRTASLTGALAGGLVFAATPLVLWEAGIAYIDNAQAMYVILAAGQIASYARRRDFGAVTLAGAMIGLALSVKTLSLVPAALAAAWLVPCRAPLRHVAAFAGLLVLLGAPFYLKTWAATGNPVYPFAHRVFGGRDWDQDRADTYASEHRSFGSDAIRVRPGDDLTPARAPYHAPTAIDRLRNWALAPLALVALPRIHHNYNDVGFLTHLGFLFAALPAAGLALGGLSRTGRAILVSVGVWLLVWSITMQYARYLTPVIALLAVASAEALDIMRRRSRVLWMASGAAIAVHLVLLAVTFGPRAVFHLAVATDAEAQRIFLRRQVGTYAATEWLNANTPRNAGVVLFEETRTFYLHRRALWGNSPHSAYIPYSDFRSAGDLVSWFRGKGVRYALLNLQFSPYAAQASGSAELRDAVATGAIDQFIIKHYGRDTDSGEPWRRLLGEAVRTGGATIIPEASGGGVAVFEMRAPRGLEG